MGRGLEEEWWFALLRRGREVLYVVDVVGKGFGV